MEYFIIMVIVFLGGIGYAFYDFMHHISKKGQHH